MSILRKTNNPSGLDSKSAGLRNELIVLSLLRRHGQLSQAQLGNLGGIQSSTASYIVGRLRDKGLILEEQGQSSKRGKKPVILRINPLGQFVVGVEINPSSVYIGLFDFNCELLESVKTALGEDHCPDHVTGILEMDIRGLLSKHNVTEDKVLGIGVALSGTVTNDGLVTMASPLGWKGVKLGEILAKKLTAPVSVYTTRVRLLAEDYLQDDALEKDSGDGKGLDPSSPAYRNVLYLNVGNGVGGNIIMDGHLIQGATNRSAELGHVVIDPDGPLCGCGHKGCLEAYVSGPAIAKRIVNDIEQGLQTTLASTVTANDLPEEVIAKWGKAVAEDDQYSLSLLDEITRHLCKAATTAINCYDPSLVILAGYVVEQFTDCIIESIEKRMPAEVYDNLSRQIRIVPARAGEEALIRGASLAVFYSTYEISQGPEI